MRLRSLLALLLGLVLALGAQPAEAGVLRWLFGGKKENAQVRLLRKNQRDGARRESVATAWLRLRHPLSTVQTQRSLVDHRGQAIVDRPSGETRRFDAAIIGPTGRVVRLVEITSRTAAKKEQEAKTARILKRGKTYVVDAESGKLHRVRQGWFFPTHIDTIRTPF